MFFTMSLSSRPGYRFASLARKVVGTVTHFATDNTIAALAFDDGPHPEYTPRLLDILEKYKVRATFFMIGKGAIEHPSIVKRIAQSGHAIGNHSWDHASFTTIRGKERREQIRACGIAIPLTGNVSFGLRGGTRVWLHVSISYI